MDATDARSHTGELAAGVARLGTETAFSVLARARAMERTGRDVIHLEIGEPDFDTPAHITEAAIAALRAGETHYCPAAGIAELRAACRGQIASYKIPRYWKLVDAFPMTITGKVQKFVMREIATAELAAV